MGVEGRTGLKLGWMMFWRLFCLTIIFSIHNGLLYSLAAAAAGAFVMVRAQLDVRIFPLMRLVLRKPVLVKGARSPVGHSRVPPVRPDTQRPRTVSRPRRPEFVPPKEAPEVGETLARPSGKGQMTGFEPAKLRSYHAPISIHAQGAAGLGLFDSDFSGSSIYSGQKGEIGFYKALCLEGLIDRCSSYWSVAMPANDGTTRPDPKFQTDIDCIVTQGQAMYLIDLKYYASGAVTWHSPDGQWLLCRDAATGRQIGKPRKMSRNMAMAQERFPRIFPNLRIKSYVVLIPTQDGLGNIAPGTVWPGDIELINLPDMLAIIRSGAGTFADDATSEKLLALIKD